MPRRVNRFDEKMTAVARKDAQTPRGSEGATCPAVAGLRPARDRGRNSRIHHRATPVRPRRGAQRPEGRGQMKKKLRMTRISRMGFLGSTNNQQPNDQPFSINHQPPTRRWAHPRFVDRMELTGLAVQPEGCTTNTTPFVVHASACGCPLFQRVDDGSQ